MMAMATSSSIAARADMGAITSRSLKSIIKHQTPPVRESHFIRRVDRCAMGLVTTAAASGPDRSQAPPHA